MISAAEASQASHSLHVATSALSMPLKTMDSNRRSPYVTPSPKWARRPGRTNLSASGLKGTSMTATKRSLIRLLCGGPAGFPLCPGLNRVFLPTSTMSKFMPVRCLTTVASQIILRRARANVKRTPTDQRSCRQRPPHLCTGSIGGVAHDRNPSSEYSSDCSPDCPKLRAAREQRKNRGQRVT